MASPAPSHDRGPVAPAADPEEIRACLPPQLVVEFDAEWDIVCEKAKSSKDLAALHSLLHKWRHLAYAEMRDPGSYSRLRAKTAEILRTGTNSTAGSYTQMRALIQERLGQQHRVYRIVADVAVTEAAATLPDDALTAYIQVLDVLEVLPWNGEPQHEDNPQGAVRRWRFGAEDAGFLVYLIDEHDHAVHLLLLVWIDPGGH